jgi:hypothetical protein
VELGSIELWFASRANAHFHWLGQVELPGKLPGRCRASLDAIKVSVSQSTSIDASVRSALLGSPGAWGGIHYETLGGLGGLGARAR